MEAAGLGPEQRPKADRRAAGPEKGQPEHQLPGAPRARKAQDLLISTVDVSRPSSPNNPDVGPVLTWVVSLLFFPASFCSYFLLLTLSVLLLLLLFSFHLSSWPATEYMSSAAVGLVVTPPTLPS